MRVVTLIALLPTLALAGWRHVGTVTGAPSDLVVADAGVVLISTSTEALAFGPVADGGFEVFATVSSGANFAGVALNGGCLSAGNSAGQIVFSSGCGAASTVSLNAVTAYRAIGARGVALSASGLTTTLASTNDVATTWSAQSPTFLQSSAARGFGLTRIGGVDFAVATTTSTARLSVDGGTPVAISGVPATADVWPFELTARPAMLAVTQTGGLVLVRDLNAPTVESLALPAGLTPRRVAAVGLQGMLSSDAGTVLSPLPDPSRPGEVWVARAGAPVLDDRLFCLDARWCAGVTSAGEIWLYENAAAPTVEVNSAISGGVAQVLADAGDSDGDPLFISWSAPGFTLAADGGVASISLGGACSASVDVSVRDALFVTTRPLLLISGERGALEVQGPETAIAGGSAIALSGGIDGGCVGAELSWSDSLGGSGSGAVFSFTPPATWCTPGTPVTVTATAHWDAGAPSTSTVQRQLTLTPWGAPEAPIFASPGTQDAGEQRVWSPINSAHVCEGASGFPGTELLWTIDAGGVSVAIVDGGLLIDSTGVCVATTVIAGAQREVVGEQLGRRSASGSLVVEVLPELAPLNASTPITLTVDAGAGIVSGELDVSASCLAQRALTAEISVDTLAQGTFVAPGAWALPVPGGCAGGTWTVTARLFEDGGFTGAQTQQQLTTEAAPVAVGTLDAGALLASCGVGFAADVTLEPAEGSCLSADVSWRAVSGPALETPSGTGSTLALQSVARDLSVVGQTLALEFTVSGGPGSSVTETRSLPISVEPFITVASRIDPPLAQLEDGRTYVFTLSNTLPCEVSGLTVKLPVRRVDSASVLLDGVPATASQTDDGLELSAVTLGAAPLELRVKGSAVLFSGSAPDASVWLNGVKVSRDNAATNPRGCGCTSLDGALLALGLLLLRPRRRSAQK